jgi:protein gp37
MSENSQSAWTNSSWKPVRGCIKVSPGGKHCYAETVAGRFRGVKGHPFEFGFDLRLVPEKPGDPLRWSTPRRIFVNPMCRTIS